MVKPRSEKVHLFIYLVFIYFYLSNMIIEQKADASPSAVGNYNMHFPLLCYISSTQLLMINQCNSHKLQPYNNYTIIMFCMYYKCAC